MRQEPGRGLPAAAAAAYGAAAVGEPGIARPALLHFAELLADADPDVWQAVGMEVAGEFAAGLRALGITCPSLDRFLAFTATVVGRLESVPPRAAHNVHRLAELGLIPPQRAIALTTGASAEQKAPEATAVLLPDAWREYRLGHVAGTVRELVRAGWAGHRVTKDAITFVLAQQTPDGAFGHPACDDPASRERARLSWTQSIVTALVGAHLDPGTPHSGQKATTPAALSRCPDRR
ncbi:hypothetical protein [Streptomyces sp. NBC_00872]|uniref:hypothetical protein n=1 Tax=Streptomyces sp. NBC_00872 TaxID=2903686 RepID=UPI002F90C51D|nr:hypothetical protein OG214_38220 [Streptomyces sp. NBC_00872]